MNATDMFIIEGFRVFKGCTASSPFADSVLRRHGYEYHCVLTPAPAPDARFNKCIHNVTRAIGRDGGGYQFGWYVEEWTGVSLRLVGHCVRTKDGRLIEESPVGHSVLFVPDDSIAVPPVDNARLGSKILLGNEHPSVGAIRDLYEGRDRIFAQGYEISGQLTGPSWETKSDFIIEGDLLQGMFAIDREYIRHLSLVCREVLPVDADCVCGSGGQVGNCCLPSLSSGLLWTVQYRQEETTPS